MSVYIRIACFVSLFLFCLQASADGKYTIRFIEEVDDGKGGKLYRLAEKKVGLDDVLKDLRSENEETREDAIRAIEWPRKWPKEDRNALIKALGERVKDKKIRIRLTACEGLERFGADCVMALPALMEAVKDEFGLIRSVALRAILSIGPKAKDAIPALITALADKESHLGFLAAEALGNIGAASVPELRKALQSTNAHVREHATNGLAVVGPEAKDALPDLKKLLSDKNRRVARSAGLAIIDIETPEKSHRIFPGKLERPPEKK